MIRNSLTEATPTFFFDGDRDCFSGEFQNWIEQPDRDCFSGEDTLDADSNLC